MFATRLKELRNNKHLTQAKLAELMGVSQQAVGLWERSKNMPSHEIVDKLASLFDVTVDYLLGRSDHPHGEPFAGQSGKNSLDSANQPPAPAGSPTVEALPEFQKGLLGNSDDDTSFAEQVREQMININVTSYEKALLEAYRQASEHEKNIVGAMLKLQEVAEVDYIKSNHINTAISNLKRNIESITGLHCHEIKASNITAGDIDHILKTNLIRSILVEQEKDSYTYIVPEMFYMEKFINDLRYLIVHYEAEPQITTEAFKVTCIECLEELRAYEYEKCMEVLETQMENYQIMTVDGIDYCIVNRDFYRIEKNGLGKYILTKMHRPPYDPKPTKKNEEEKPSEYGYAA